MLLQSQFSIDALPNSEHRTTRPAPMRARRITTHGFALNVNTDLSYFDLIVACEGEPVTSMKELLGREVEMSAVEDRIIERFAEVFEMEMRSEPAAVVV